VGVQAPGAMLAGGAVGVPLAIGVEDGVGCGEVIASEDAVGDGVIATGPVADEQAMASRPTTVVAAAREIEEDIGSPCDPPYGSTTVAV